MTNIWFMQRGSENFLTTSVKNAFHIYDMSKLRLKIVSSPPTKRKIRALAAFGDFTFTAGGNEVLRFRRGKQESVVVTHDDNIRLLTVIGSHLFSLSDDGVLCVSEIEKGHDAGETIQRTVLSDAGIRSQKTGLRASITAWLHSVHPRNGCMPCSNYQLFFFS